MSKRGQQGVRMCHNVQSVCFFATGLPYPEGVYTAGESDQGGERHVQEGPGQSPEVIEMVKVQMQTRLFDVLDRCLCFSSFDTCGDCPSFPIFGEEVSVFFAAWLCHCGVASMYVVIWTFQRRFQLSRRFHGFGWICKVPATSGKASDGCSENLEKVLAKLESMSWAHFLAVRSCCCMRYLA